VALRRFLEAEDTMTGAKRTGLDGMAVLPN
jgi:hypothetical protein